MQRPFLWVFLLGEILLGVGAQNITSLLGSIPSCALPCVLTGISEANCSFDSLAECICSNVPLQSELSACTQQSCGFDDQVATAQVSNQLCVGYPIDSRQHEVRAIAVVSLAITVPIVALRCYSRYSTTRQLWWDDWAALVATALLIALGGVEIHSANLGFGLHYWNVDPVKGKTIIQMFYAAQILYIAIQVAAKVSILAFFSRIFPARWFKWTVRSAMVFLVTHGALFILLVALQCLPVHAVWERNLPRKCINVTALGYVGAVFSIVEDLFILVLPLPELLKLQMGTHQKISLVFLFSIGSFACVTSMVRLKYLVSFSSTYDTTWDNVNIVMWSLIEEFCAILCCSLPALKPLLQKVPGLFSTMRTLRSKSSSSNTQGTSSSHLDSSHFQKLPDSGGFDNTDAYSRGRDIKINTNVGDAMELGEIQSPASYSREKKGHHVV